MRHLTRSQFVLMLTAGVLTACGEPTSTVVPAAVPISSIEIDALTSSLVPDQKLELTATAKAADGSVVPVRAIVWTSSDAAIAAVAATGPVTAEVHAISAGSVTITAAAESHSGQLVLKVTTTPLQPSTSLAFIWTQLNGMSVLPMLPGATVSDASAINDLGQVVGSVRIGGRDHAFVWTPAGGMVDIGGLSVPVLSYATAINNAGQVAGWSVDASGHNRAFRWSPREGMIALGVLPGAVNSYARGINSSGQVVGESEATTGRHPFRWTPERGMEDLGLVGSDPDGEANGINDSGDIVGFTSDGQYYETVRPVLWPANGDKKVIASCTGAFGCYGSASAINSTGQIAGSLQTPGNGPTHAFRWTVAGAVQDLGVLPGSISSYGGGINEAGQVVGSSASASGSFAHAFLWSPAGGMVDLGVLAGKTWSSASGINKNGQVVGSSQ